MAKGVTRQHLEALKAYDERLKLINKQLANLNKTSKDYKRLQAEKNKVTKQGAAAQKELAAATGKLSSTLPNNKKLIDQAAAAQKSWNRNTNAGASASKNFFGKLKTAVGTLGRYALAYGGINAVLTTFRELTIGSARQAIAFEKEVANLGAVAGVSGDQLKKLSDNALDVAGSTKFTAQEIVGLQTALAKLGFSAEDVVASTRGIANTAQALGSPLNTTAEQIGKVINQFDLLIEQSDFVGDVLVTTINNSALSFESFGTAIQYVGPIAKNLGLSFEQTAGAMAVLSDNGFTASRVGTGLRGIFTELGKTSADVEKSLRKLAEQNISLSEAVDLVGKRNAAQLITLLDNIDALDESNSKYYEQGRAIEASAKQIDTFDGQLKILNSAFRETQIGIGQMILDSDLLLDVMGFLSREAEGLGRAMKNIKEIGFADLNKGVEDILSGSKTERELAIERVAKRTGKSIEQITELYENYADGVIKNIYDPQLQGRVEKRVSLVSDEAIEVQGLVDEIERLIEAKKQDFFMDKGRAEANSIFKDSVDALIDKSLEGINVNKEANKIYEELEFAIENYDKALNSANKTTEEERLFFEAAKKTLKGYQDQVKNTIISEDELRKAREQKQKEETDPAIKNIQEQRKKEIDFLNERAKVETAIAETTEEKADIEAERTRLVSEAYAKEAKQLSELSEKYDTQKDKLLELAKAAEDSSKILTSDVFADAQTAFNGYSSELKDLQKALDDKIITQEDYNASVSELRGRLMRNIESFRELIGTSPELEKFFDNLILDYDYLSTATAKADKKTKDIIDTFDEWIDQFKKEDWAKYAEQAINATGEVFSEFNDTQLENTKNRLESEIDAIKNRYKVEEDILKSQLDNQLITESQYRAKQLELRKAQIAEENTINKKIFDADKKQDRQDAILQGAEAIALAYVNAFKEAKGNPLLALAIGSISAGIISAKTAGQVSAINQRKFFPKKYEQGGVVNGPSHADGGVPFTVQGQAGYEMEGGEFIVNKRATAMHRDLLERINNSYRTRPQIGNLKFADGGLVPNAAGQSVDYLKAIAEATASTAVNTNKPVRAFVADKDLRNNATERRLRDRNDRI